MNTKELLDARIHGAIVQLKLSVDSYIDHGDHPVSVVELQVEPARRILKALVRDMLFAAADEIGGDFDADEAVRRLRELASGLT